ncbi:MAG: stalk domain-containing protein [Bacillota bacterium]
MRKLIKTIVPLALALVLNVGIADADQLMDIQEKETSPSIKIFIDGEEQIYSVAPMIINGRTFVPMRGVFETFETKVDWIEETKTVKAAKEDVDIEVTVGSYFAKKNEDTIQLDAKPFIYQDRTMVPLRFISEAFGAEVTWNEQERNISIITKVSEETDVEADKTNLLTYEEAIEKALKHSYTLKNQLGQLEKLEDSRENITINEYPSSTGNGQEDAQRLSQLKSVKSLDINIEMTKKDIESTKESIGFEVRNAMNEINKLLSEKKLMTLELENAKTNLEMAKTKAGIGSISKYDLQKEEDTYHKAVNEKDVLEKSIESAYMKLNNLIGVSQSQQYVVEENIKYEPVSEKNVDYLVTKGISESPSIWNQEKKIELAELDLDLYVFNAGGDSYSAKEIDLQLEQNNLASLKLSLEQSIRTTYNQIEQLEKNYELLEVNLKSAERDLALVRAQYDLGLATKIQLKQAELKVAQTKSDMKSKAIEHEKLKTKLYKPYLTN